MNKADLTSAMHAPNPTPGLGGRMIGLALSSRPRQWPKNLLVLAALLFAREFHSGASVVTAVAATAIFTLASAGLYILNDAFDAPRDREHPVKRHRPIAAGIVPVKLAVGAGIVISAVALALAAALAWTFGAALAVYLGVQIGYSLVLKHLVILDLLAIAIGFVIRAVAGALVIEVPISPWLYICTFLLALFLAVGKRWAELNGDARTSAARPVLDRYTAEFLRTLVVITAAATPLSYALYTFSAPNLPANHLMMITIPIVLYGILRYVYLLQANGSGEEPERVLLGDPGILASVVVWVTVSWAILQFGGG
ncbi:MAG: decaprenyl-phosphate phosphoribosyltransferase [Chloroflexi bacterium]|nr:decaprenyl-phosphate phosphoribosyltransferase [Chloroflexota bacterium]